MQNGEISTDQLPTSKNQIEMCLEMGRVGTWTWDLSTDLISLNKSAQTILGYNIKHLKEFALYCHPEDLDKVHQSLNNHVHGLTDVHDVQYRTKGHDTTTYKYMHARGRIDRNSNIFEGVIMDVTNEVEVSNRLEESEQRFRFLVESVRDYAIYWLDMAGNVSTWNYGAERLLGYTSEEIIGQHFSIMHMPELRIATKIDFSQTTISASVFESEGWRVKKNGSRFWAYVTTTALKDKNDKLLGFGKVVRDMTNPRMSGEKLRIVLNDLQRSNHELEEFAYVASHDLKAPLRAISNLSEWIAEELISIHVNDDIKEYLRLLKTRCARMEGMIDGLLSYSKIGKLEQDKTVINTSDLLDEIIDLIPHDGIVIKIVKPLPKVVANRTRLGQIFLNLISNAIKHHDRKEGLVTVSYRDAGEYHEFCVSDDGPGIDPKYHKKIFQLFQTLKPRDEHEATGIGLTMIEKILKDYAGKICVESQGRGSKFIFTLSKDTCTISS